MTESSSGFTHDTSIEFEYAFNVGDAILTGNEATAIRQRPDNTREQRLKKTPT